MKYESDIDDYQWKAFDFAKSHGSSLLALEMGLGKSVISATYQRDLLYSFHVKHVLIVAPKKVALNTWPDEFGDWDHLKDMTFNQMAGLNAKDRVKAAHNLQDINVINRENLIWLIKLWGRDWPYESIVLDEAKWCCGGQTFKALKKVRPMIDHATLLSGTPAPNGHLDLFGQAWMVDQGKTLGTHITHYRNRYFDKNYMGYGYDIKPWAADVINEKMKNIALYMAADDHINLPPIVPRTIRIEMQGKLRDKYDFFKEEFILRVEDESILADSSAILSNKLLQFCNGAVYDEDKNVHHFHDEKLDMLEEIVKNSDRPVLCAYSYKHDIPRLAKRFPKATFMSDDTGIQKRWNAGKIPLLFCHPASAGFGLNLQFGGNVIVWFGLTWSLELYWQFIYRLRRRGQESDSIIVNHLTIKDSVEDRLIAALYQKGITQQKLLDTIKAEI